MIFSIFNHIFLSYLSVSESKRKNCLWNGKQSGSIGSAKTGYQFKKIFFVG